jgi:hypothetical protein
MAKGTSTTIIEAQGLPQFLRYLKQVGDQTMPTQIRLAGKKVAVDVADVVRGAIPAGKETYPHGGGDKHPGRLKGSVSGLASARIVHIQIGRGAAQPYARPQLFGRRPDRYKRFYDPIMDRIEAITPQVIEEYRDALVEALQDARV